jgi:DNA-binding PucR family transcriptional regulator
MTSYGAIALSSAKTRPEEIAVVVARVLDARALELVVSDEDVQISVAHDHHDAQGWLRLVDDWHAMLKREVGDISVGHAAPRAGPSATRRTRFEAAEALRLGERAFGGGHLTGYGDAQLAAFLLRHADLDDLRSLYERTLGKLFDEDRKRGSDLLATLHAYCDTGGSLSQTAERLGVHRNTVLYRVRRIQTVTLTNLQDGPSRLLLQVGMVAGRLARPSVAHSLRRAPA